MSDILERELRAAFDAATDHIQPAPTLADKARQARRVRRRRQLAIGLACFALVVAASGAYASGRTVGPALAHRPAGPHLLLRVEYPVSQAAVSGPSLYLTSNSSDLVAAYDRRTGKLIRQVSVPGGPTSLAVGPTGLVWVGVEGYSSPGATMLFNPGLAVRAQLATGFSPLVPTGRQTAVTPSQYGLIELQLPAPGRWQVSQHVEPGTSLGPPRNTAPGVWAGQVDGRVVVEVTNGYGYDIHLVIAGQPARTYGGALDDEVGAVAITGSAVWAQTFAIKNSTAQPYGPLVRLDDQLQLTTPMFVRRSAVLAKSAAVWSAGGTVWVATGAAGHALVCFSASSQSGRVITVQRTGNVATLAATAEMAYVVTTEGESFGPSSVTSYPVPAACR